MNEWSAHTQICNNDISIEIDFSSLYDKLFLLKFEIITVNSILTPALCFNQYVEKWLCFAYCNGKWIYVLLKSAM